MLATQVVDRQMNVENIISVAPQSGRYIALDWFVPYATCNGTFDVP
jgi:hypothetical protein